jgi:hypothetical protein
MDSGICSEGIRFLVTSGDTAVSLGIARAGVCWPSENGRVPSRHSELRDGRQAGARR